MSNGNLWIFGGRNDSGASIADISVLSSAGAWTQNAASLPSPQSNTSVTSSSGSSIASAGGNPIVVSYGGETPGGCAIYSLPPSPAQAPGISACVTNLPPPRSAPALAMMTQPRTDGVWLFGGALPDGGVLADLWTMDPGAGSWTAITSIGTRPPARSAAILACDVVKNTIIVSGGFDAAGRWLQDTWMYSPASNTWTELDGPDSGALYPAPREENFAQTTQAAGQPATNVYAGFGAGDAGTDLWAFRATAQNRVLLRAPVGITRKDAASATIHVAVTLGSASAIVLYAWNGATWETIPFRANCTPQSCDIAGIAGPASFLDTDGTLNLLVEWLPRTWAPATMAVAHLTQIAANVIVTLRR